MEPKQRSFVVLVVTISLIVSLFVITLTDWQLGLAERLGLQSPGLYPVADEEGVIRLVSGAPYIPQYSVLAIYLLLTLVGAWFFLKRSRGRKK